MPHDEDDVAQRAGVPVEAVMPETVIEAADITALERELDAIDAERAVEGTRPLDLGDAPAPASQTYVYIDVDFLATGLSPT